jgi:hypothetical protein
MNDSRIRWPDAYVNPEPGRKTQKWERIISLFMENDMSELVLSHRTGARGRILSVLAQKTFRLLHMPFKVEPIFIHKKPNRWYVDFARVHNLKLRTHDFYNPDLFFEDGTWAEITLSENTAYKKLFRYGHQADKLAVFWLDEDIGLHKEICRAVRFPNARVMSIESLCPQLETVSGGPELIERLTLLKGLKGIIL